MLGLSPFQYFLSMFLGITLAEVLKWAVKRWWFNRKKRLVLETLDRAANGVKADLRRQATIAQIRAMADGRPMIKHCPEVHAGYGGCVLSYPHPGEPHTTAEALADRIAGKDSS